MKVTYPILLFASCLILFCQCSTTGSQESATDQLDSTATSAGVSEVNNEGLHNSDYGIFSKPLQVGKAMPDYRIEFHIPDEKIYVYSTTEGEEKRIQELPISADINYEDGYLGSDPMSTIDFKDYNFDQHVDLGVLSVAGAYNELREVYLFNSSKEVFERHAGLSELTNIELDTVSNTISSINNGGMGGAWYDISVYKIVDQNLTALRSESQESFDGSMEIFIRTFSEFTSDGKKVVLSKVRIEKHKEDGEKHCLLEGEWAPFDADPSLIFTDDPAKVVRFDGRNGSCE